MPKSPEATNANSADKKDWYRHPLTIAGAAVVAAGLATGIGLAATSGNNAPSPVKPEGGTEAGATPNWNDPETFAGVNNNLSGAEIKSVYSALYGVFGDKPPFDLNQYIDVMSKLSQEDADFMVSASQGNESRDAANSLLKANGLVFDAAYPVN